MFESEFWFGGCHLYSIYCAQFGEAIAWEYCSLISYLRMRLLRLIGNRKSWRKSFSWLYMLIDFACVRVQKVLLNLYDANQLRKTLERAIHALVFPRLLFAVACEQYETLHSSHSGLRATKTREAALTNGSLAKHSFERKERKGLINCEISILIR